MAAGKRFSHLVLRMMLGIVCIAQILPPTHAQTKVLMCYWASWSHYRTGQGRYSIDDVDATLCTHFIYSFATISTQTYQIQSADPRLDYGPTDPIPGVENMYRRAVGLKSRNQNLKVLLAVGGANLASKVFSDMASNPVNRKLFIDSVVNLITTYEFDGLDVDWEFPNGDGTQPADEANFPTLLTELKARLGSMEPPKLLTAAIGAGPGIVDKVYRFQDIIDSKVDLLNVMTYDFKSYDDNYPLIGHHSPLYKSAKDNPANRSLTVDYAINEVILPAIPNYAYKITLGIPTYGRTYTLRSAREHEFYNKAAGKGVPYTYSNEPGIISYYEICLNLVGATGWEFEFQDEHQIPYTYNGTQWIGYDNEESIMAKVDYAVEKQLAGIFVWSLDQDDCRNYCESWIENCGLSQIIKGQLAYHAAHHNPGQTTPSAVDDSDSVIES